MEKYVIELDEQSQRGTMRVGIRLQWRKRNSILLEYSQMLEYLPVALSLVRLLGFGLRNWLGHCTLHNWLLDVTIHITLFPILWLDQNFLHF